MKMEVITTAITCRQMIREIIDLKRNTLFVLSHEIPNAAYGVNLHLGATLGQLPSQTVNIDFDGIRGEFARKTDEVVFGEFLGNHAALATHQEFENRQLARREHFRLVVDERLPASDIEYEIANAQGTSKHLTGPAQHGF